MNVGDFAKVILQGGGEYCGKLIDIKPDGAITVWYVIEGEVGSTYAEPKRTQKITYEEYVCWWVMQS